MITPTPWVTGYEVWVTGHRAADMLQYKTMVFVGKERAGSGGDHDLVACIPHGPRNKDQAHADAEFIVKAVNAHEELVKALMFYAASERYDYDVTCVHVGRAKVGVLEDEGDVARAALMKLIGPNE
jgi:hypothetical protein